MEKLSTEIKNYIKMTSSDELQPILNPLRHLKITYFLFIREFLNGSRLWLTNNGQWSEHFYSKGYYKISAFEDPVEERIQGVYLWKYLRGQEVFQEARENFNIGNGMTLVEKHDKEMDFFHFAGDSSQADICCSLTNNIDMLSRFAKYFRYQAKKLINIAEINMVDVPKPEARIKEGPITAISSDDVNNFFKEIGNGRYYLGGDMTNEYLTQKEVECLQWCIRGKTLEEIALILSIAKRTVEAHVDSVKRKLRCYKQFELGYKLAKNGFIEI